MNDVEWLAQRVGTLALAESLLDEPSAPAGIVVEPSLVGWAAARSEHVIAMVGWPTGRHHTLIKSAEARLAGEMGAGEVWVVVNKHADKQMDDNATLAELVALRNACEPSLRVGAVVPQGQEQLVDLACLDVLVLPVGREIPAVQADVAVYGEVVGLEHTVDLIAAGATRVFAADPTSALAE